MRILFAFVLVLFGASTAALAEGRVALVIGNSSYQDIAPLKNPRNDAELMASTLSDVGFEVVVALDVDRRGMARAVRAFGTALRGAGARACAYFP